MNLQHLEEKVASAEERSLHLSLIRRGLVENEELAEVRNNINHLELEACLYTCNQGQKLAMRLDAIRAELEAIEHVTGRSRDSLTPVAA